MRHILLRATLVLMIGAVASTGSGTEPTAPPPQTPWSWPTGGAHEVLRGFAAPATIYGPGHRGIDILASTELFAPADGVVHYAGWVFGRPVLSIEHTDGTLSSYEPVIASVERGEVVRRGQLVGLVTPGHCLHLCVHVGARRDGRYLSPLNFLGGIPRSVLLPVREVPG